MRSALGGRGRFAPLECLKSGFGVETWRARDRQDDGVVVLRTARSPLVSPEGLE